MRPRALLIVLGIAWTLCVFTASAEQEADTATAEVVTEGPSGASAPSEDDSDASNEAEDEQPPGVAPNDGIEEITVTGKALRSLPRRRVRRVRRVVW